MKKQILILVALFGFTLSINAQSNFELGINAGVPVGNVVKKFTSFTAGIEANYYFLYLNDNFKVGASAGYLFFKGKSGEKEGNPIDAVSYSDTHFLPLAANFRYNIADKLVLGTDLGYGVGLSPKGNQGGFYIRPSLGYRITDKATLQASFSNIDVKDGTDKSQYEFGSLSLGVIFNL